MTLYLVTADPQELGDEATATECDGVEDMESICDKLLHERRQNVKVWTFFGTPRTQVVIDVKKEDES